MIVLGITGGVMKSERASEKERGRERKGHALARLLVSNCNEEGCTGRRGQRESERVNSLICVPVNLSRCVRAAPRGELPST